MFIAAEGVGPYGEKLFVFRGAIRGSRPTRERELQGVEKE